VNENGRTLVLTGTIGLAAVGLLSTASAVAQVPAESPAAHRIEPGRPTSAT
jgi:hypothetical protein